MLPGMQANQSAFRSDPLAQFTEALRAKPRVFPDSQLGLSLASLPQHHCCSTCSEVRLALSALTAGRASSRRRFPRTPMGQRAMEQETLRVAKMRRPDEQTSVTGETSDIHATVPPPSLGELIRRRRAELGLSQCDLEARLGGGACPGTVARLERSRAFMPSWLRLLQLASVLKLPVAELLAAAETIQGITQPREDSSTSQPATGPRPKRRAKSLIKRTEPAGSGVGLLPSGSRPQREPSFGEPSR
jgi:transcriptional regulator with XRE-family HTH domain